MLAGILLEMTAGKQSILSLQNYQNRARKADRKVCPHFYFLSRKKNARLGLLKEFY